MVKFTLSLAVRQICRACGDFFRFLWGFISRWFSRGTACVFSALGRRKAPGETTDSEDESPRSESSGEAEEAEEGQPAAAAEGSDIAEDGDDLSGEEYRVDPADELYCDYDSTWEDEHDRKSRKTRRSMPSANYKFRRFETAAKDMQNYRHDYPFVVHSHNDMPNLEFYLGKRRCLPHEMYIYDFHNWYENYDALESVHTYVQWLFPLQEPGMNSAASTLTKAEIKEFCKSDTAMANLLESYKLMLNFYGIRLRDVNTGEVERAANWRERFDNLNSHTHNSLRITRILKCLGTLGYHQYQYPLVLFFLKETLKNKNLPRIKDSVLSYFVFAVLNKMKRRRLIKFAYLHYEPKDEFVWCPKNIQTIWLRRYEHRKNFMLNREQIHSTVNLSLDDD